MHVLLGYTLVFVAAIVYDYVFALYIRYAALRDPGRAAIASSATYLIGVIGLLAVTKSNTLYIIPEALGLGVGTYFGILRQKRTGSL